MPMIEAVDLRAEPPRRGRWMTPRLVDAMAATLARGEQTMLFLNRRGYAPLTLCRACGHRMNCPNCAAWLVEHRLIGPPVCHHCGPGEEPPPPWPHCPAGGPFLPC